MDTMIDIETLGTQPGCVIVSIGAVHFDERGLERDFYMSVDIESCQEAGLTIDANTLSWWLDQSSEAQKELQGGHDLRETLLEYSLFHEGNIWANAPTFDCSIVRYAYEAVDLEPPWRFWEERCYRTIKELGLTLSIPHGGIEHNALDDAKAQAEAASAALRKLEEL